MWARPSNAVSFGLGARLPLSVEMSARTVVVERLCRQSVDLVAGSMRVIGDFTRTLAQASLALFLVSTVRSHLVLLRLMMVRIALQTSFVRPARITQLLLRSSAFTVGVTYGWSDDVTVVSSSGTSLTPYRSSSASRHFCRARCAA